MLTHSSVLLRRFWVGHVTLHRVPLGQAPRKSRAGVLSFGSHTGVLEHLTLVYGNSCTTLVVAVSYIEVNTLQRPLGQDV